MVYCSMCDGNSFDLDTGDDCTACGGTGRVPAGHPAAGESIETFVAGRETDDGILIPDGTRGPADTRVGSAYLEIVAAKRRLEDA